MSQNKGLDEIIEQFKKFQFCFWIFITLSMIFSLLIWHLLNNSDGYVIDFDLWKSIVFYLPFVVGALGITSLWFFFQIFSEKYLELTFQKIEKIKDDLSFNDRGVDEAIGKKIWLYHSYQLKSWCLNYFIVILGLVFSIILVNIQYLYIYLAIGIGLNLLMFPQVGRIENYFLKKEIKKKG